MSKVKVVVKNSKVANEIIKYCSDNDIDLEEQRKYDERLKRCMEEVNEYY